MIKKIFGLASVTVLTGFVVAVSAAGCSGVTTYYYADEGGLEGGPKTGLKPGDPGYTPPVGTTPTPIDASKPPPPKVDASTDPDPPGTCPSTDPITAADIDAQLQWKAPVAFQNVCTQQNIDALKNLFKTAVGGVKYADIKSALGATCSACAFSPIAAANWQVFVEDAGGAIDNRTGSCFAQRSGNSCGQARFRWESCLDAACPESDCGAGGVQTCIPKAQKGACLSLTNAYATACPNEATDLPICGSIFGAIATSCSGGPTNTINIAP